MVGRRIERENSHASILPEHASALGVRRTESAKISGVQKLLSSSFAMSRIVISALDQEGRGVARIDGKTVFVEGALVGERASVEIVRRKPTYDLAHVVEIESTS